MSNKTNLQALNANYEALIEELRGKAAGGGSGGDITHVTVSFVGKTAALNVDGISFDADYNAYCPYMPLEFGKTFTSISNSIIEIEGMGGEEYIFEAASDDGTSSIIEEWGTGCIIRIGISDTTITIS